MCEESFVTSLTEPETINRSIRNIILSSVVSSPSLVGRTTTGGRIDAKLALDQFRAMKRLGDCCDISINQINIIEESCINASDAELSVDIEATDLRGGLSYQLSSLNFNNIIDDGVFSFIPADSYDLSVRALRDSECRVDTALVVSASAEPCLLEDFAVTNIFPNPSSSGQARLLYSLDEAKSIQVVAYNVLGQLVYLETISSDIALSGNIDIDLTNLASGLYHVGIRANDLLATIPYLIIR